MTFKNQMQTLEELKLYLRKFAEDRDWVQFHSPKNLSMALSVEVAELAEHFQWLTEEQSLNLDAERKKKVAEEIADIQLYLVRLADRLDIDILDAVNSKTKANEQRFVIEQVKGSAEKVKGSA